MKRMKAFIKSWAAPVLIAVSVFCLFRFVLILGYVPSRSMEPTLKTGSLILGTGFILHREALELKRLSLSHLLIMPQVTNFGRLGL